MKTEICKGVLSFLGAPTIDNNTGARVYSVVDIGNYSLRNVACSQYLASHLNPGEELELELFSPRGFFSLPAIYVLPIVIFIWALTLSVMDGNWCCVFVGSLACLVLLMINMLIDMIPMKNEVKVIKTVTVNGKTHKN